LRLWLRSDGAISEVENNE